MITPKDITKLSELARIALDEQEKKSLKKDLEEIFRYMANLKKADISGTSELTHTLNVVNEMREDTEVEPPALYTVLLTKAFSAVKSGFLKVKYIFK